MRALSTIFALSLAAVAAAPLAAQGASAADPTPARAVSAGARVRLTGPEGARVGRVTSVMAEGISVLFPRETESVLVPHSAVGYLEISIARQSHALIGAGIGLFGGLVFGAVRSPGDGCTGSDVCSALEVGARGLRAVGFGLLGAVSGLLIGGAAQTDQWAPAATPSTALVSVSPVLSGDGMRVSVTLQTR